MCKTNRWLRPGAASVWNLPFFLIRICFGFRISDFGFIPASRVAEFAKNVEEPMIAAFLLAVSGLYLLCGLVFAIPFVLVGVGKIDPHANHGSWGFRLLIIPGTTFLWPLLARRWFKGVHEPPEENNPHRCAARKEART